MRIINIAFFFLLLLCSCGKKNDFYAELGQGSYLTLVNSSTFLDAGNSDAAISLVVNKVGRDVKAVNVYVAASPTLDKAKWKLIKNVPFNGETTLSVTNREIATALGLTPGALSPGSVFNLYNEIETVDGQVFSSINTSAADLENQLAFNVAFQWAGTVICPYDASSIAGTYTVVRDDWQDWVPGDKVEVTAGTGANEINLSAVWPNADYADIVTPFTITVNPDNGVVTVPDNITFGDYGAYTAGTAAGSNGFVFSCLGKIAITVHILAPPFGDQGLFQLVLQK